jgi:hypothetical protein
VAGRVALARPSCGRFGHALAPDRGLGVARAVQFAARIMQHHPRSPLSQAFDALFDAFVRLDIAWTDDRERSGMRYAFGDARHHLCHALVVLEDVTHDPARLVPHGAYHLLDGATSVLAREAYLSVLGLGQLLQSAREFQLAPAHALDTAARTVELVLEELSPFVSRADGGLRRTLLDGVPLEVVLADLEARA